MNTKDITQTDIVTLVNIIDICAERGAFKGNELFTIGQLRDKFASMVTEVSETNSETDD